MEFLTLHELSLQLDVSVRVLRHRVRQLLQAGKLTENVDCKRDGYVDETHFVWLVNPIAFARAAGLRPVIQAVSQGATAAIQPVAPPLPPPTQPAAMIEPAAHKPEPKAPGMEREIIDLLKDQVRVKDVQIADLSEQNKALNGLHMKLTGQIVQQAEKIQSLLELPAGRGEPRGVSGAARPAGKDEGGLRVGEALAEAA